MGKNSDMTPPRKCDVVVVGAGLAGLACASRLSATGLDVQVLEACEGVGGRARTDRVDGFLLDRGFQVLNTGYPEVRRLMDTDALDLRYFSRAMLLHVRGSVVRLADPRREPLAALAAIRAPIGSLRDKAALAGYAAAVGFVPNSVLLGQRDRTAEQAWRRYGMTPPVIDRVLRPFFAGLLLENEMTTSGRFANLMMRMFVRGDSTVPAAGMQALGEQLAARLPTGSVHLQTPASSIAPLAVETSAGLVAGRAVVVATDASAAAALLPGVSAPSWKGVTTVYHAAQESPLKQPTLVVDAEKSPINNTVVVTEAAPSYSSDGRALIATSLVHGPDLDGAAVDERAMLGHLARLYRTSTSGWERVAAYDVPHALPSMTAPHEFRKPVRTDGVYVCGDHRDTSSIQGALVSGRRAADAVLSDLGVVLDESDPPTPPGRNGG